MASRALARRLAALTKLSEEMSSASPRAFATAAAAKVPVEEETANVKPKETRTTSSSPAAPQRRPSPGLFSDFFSPLGQGTSLLSMMDTMDRLFDNSFVPPASASRILRSSTRTPWDVMEDEKSFKLRMDMPGLSKEEVKVAVEDGDLTIKGEHKVAQGEDDWSARSYGSYNIRIKLPDSVQVEGIKADMKNGVLRVVAPKAQQSRKVEVRLE